MQNPFKYGGVVGEAAFCNREQEQQDLRRAIENGDNLFVYSERRLGKTSLIRLVLEDLPKDQYVSAYVDLWPTDSEISFATVMAKALAEAMSTTADKLLETARAFFGRLAPSVTLDDQGKPQVLFGINRSIDAAVEL
ncbi:MAG: hypothetical protein QGG64_01955, partial [Candidatus Latescibacteria bacterium]|nr:hypothetical protein [Candidatus Latescibacterota bacterium]